jgi:phospholipid/cholesterol/gamma-HCH transport system substrate-binding protein
MSAAPHADAVPGAPDLPSFLAAASLPMPRPLTWRSLGGGIVALAAIVVCVVGVLRYARVGALRGDTFTLYLTASESRDVIPGTDVWLQGRRIGVVDRVGFQSSSAPLAERVMIRARILARDRDQIRIGSHARFRAGGTLIGARVVDIAAAPPTTRAVRDGDTIVVEPPFDLQLAMGTAVGVLDSLPAISANVKQAAADARAARAELAGIAASGTMREIRGSVGALRTRLTGSRRGTLGRALANRDDLTARVRGTMATVDTIRSLLSSRRTAFGRFRRDSTLIGAVAAIRDDVDSLRRLTRTPTGTAGRLLTDSALVVSLDSAHVALRALVADMKERPLRYLHIF